MTTLAKLTTPAGTAVYPRLNSPDFGKGKYKNKYGVYKVDISIPKADAKSLIVAWKKAMKEAAAMGKGTTTEHPQLWEEVDDQGAKTGNIVLRCKATNMLVKSTGKVWDRKPPLFDAKGMPCAVKVGGGSKIKCSVEFYGMNDGDEYAVRVNLIAVQVLDLVEYGKNAESYGFGAEEGFEANDEQKNFSEDDDETSSDEVEDEDEDADPDLDDEIPF